MKKASRSSISREDHIGVRCAKSCSDDVNTFNYNSVSVWRSAGIFSTSPGLDDSKGAYKKKKKKGKLNKLHSQVISSIGISDMSSCLKDIFMGIESTNSKAGDKQYKIGLSNPKEILLAPMGSYSECTRGFETGLADGYQTIPGQSNCRKNEIHKTSETTSKLVNELKGSNARDRKILSMTSCLAASVKSHDMVSEINLKAERHCKYSRNKEVVPDEGFSMPNDLPAIEPKPYDPKEGHFHSLYGKSQVLCSINNRRKHIQLFRQRVRDNVGCLQSEGAKAFHYCHPMAKDVSHAATSPLKLRCYKGDGLLPSPPYHCAYKHGYLPPKVPQLSAELKSRDQYIHLEARFKVADDLRAVIWQKPEDKFRLHLKSSINGYKRRLRADEARIYEYRPNLLSKVSPEFLRERYLHSCHLQEIDSYGSRTSELLEDTEYSSQGNEPYLGLSPWQQHLNEIRPEIGIHKFSAKQDATAEAFFASQNNRISSFSSFEPKLLLNYNVEGCINSLGNSLKSIHLSLSPEYREEGDDSCIRKEHHTKTCSANSCGEDSGELHTNVINFENGEQGTLVGEYKGGRITKGYRVKKSSMYVGSAWAEQALVTAYKLQGDSAYVKLVTGSPIANFEKFLTSASPVIVPSFSIKEERDFFFTIQDPSVILQHIWSWYEKPGCYGLEINAGDSQNSGRLKSLDESFLAYFVPSLSAIQLFSYSHFSKSRRTIETVHQKEESGKCSLLSSFLIHLCPGSLTDTKDHSLLNPVEKHNENQESSRMLSPSESKLIFEFFENDLPHERMPLYAKVKNLIKDGANLHVSGNPSILECMKLQDLHPSSWYSVAWYPIYRIPDGPFRMTFLTYHSLGHFSLNPSRSSSSKQDVVCPVLGMLSYNTKNDGWFILNENARKSLHKGRSWDSDVSKLLQDRISNLAETATIFAAGITSMNNVKVKNAHQDYNFFLSRQQ